MSPLVATRHAPGEPHIDSGPSSAAAPGAPRATGERHIDTGPASAAAPGAPRATGERHIDTGPASAAAPRDGVQRRIGGANGARADGHPAADAGVVELAVRRNARTLHAACAELLPGYAAASREPWRQALLTAGCLDARPRRAAGRRPAPPLIVEDVVQPSDVLCALWLARRCGLFSPGSPCGDAVGRRSACEIVPVFAPGAAREAVWETLRANTAWQAHRAARAVAA